MKLFNVNGEQLNMYDIMQRNLKQPGFVNSWPMCREKVAYYGMVKYGDPDRWPTANYNKYYWYKHYGLPLSEYEQRELDIALENQKTRYQEYIEKKQRRSRKKKVL